MAARQESSTSSGSRKSGSRAVVGQFNIGSEIGKGSFAQVYLGWHKLERLNKKLRENLYSEIQILKTLRHPHIVALHDCLESTSHINLIMEYCELGDLSLFIKKREKLATHPATHDMARKYPSAPNSVPSSSYAARTTFTEMSSPKICYYYPHDPSETKEVALSCRPAKTR
ncbi:hypothetical protein LB503_006422 [Fusarium chuoi]|nr:hypothetical protein LB503_006422 [Fusarium chuoi]